MTPRTRRARRARRASGTDAGATSPLALLVATFVFTSSVPFVLALLHEPVDAKSQNQRLHARASDALRVLTTTPGSPPDWAHLPPGSVERLGLARITGTTQPVTDQAKYDKWRGTLENPFPLHDLKRALDLTKYGVHVQVTPDLDATANGSSESLERYRTAYVGEHAPGGTETPASERERDALRTLALPFDGSKARAVDHQSRGHRYEDTSLYLKRELVPRLAGFNSVTYSQEVPPDPDPSVWTVFEKGEYATASWWQTGTPTRLLTASKWDGTGFAATKRDHSLTVGVLDLTPYGTAHAVRLDINHYYAPGIQLPFRDKISIIGRCLTNCTSANPADVTLWSTENSAGTRGDFQEKTVDLATFKGQTFLLRFVYERKTVGVGVQGEGWFLSYIAVNATRGGRVTPLVDNRLAFSTSTLDALIVGSNVDHASFRAPDGLVKNAVHDWVQEGGGLLVLGSEKADAAWLTPHFTNDVPPADSRLGAGGVLARETDHTHPAVTTPNTLTPATHEHAPQAYPANPKFRRVVVGANATAGPPVPLLSVSEATNRFDGSVILTTARPALVANGEEARRALADWLTHIARHSHHHATEAEPPDHASRASARATLQFGDATSQEPGATITLTIWERRDQRRARARTRAGARSEARRHHSPASRGTITPDGHVRGSRRAPWLPRSRRRRERAHGWRQHHVHARARVKDPGRAPPRRTPAGAGGRERERERVLR